MESGALASDTEDAINLALAIVGVKVAFIMIEQLKGGFKVSFRSRCHVDCNELARTFGGGGHGLPQEPSSRVTSTKCKREYYKPHEQHSTNKPVHA